MAAVLALGACRSSLPTPLFTSHEGEDGTIVPDLPPPARVEVVQSSAERGTVWIDGEWQWREGAWRWRPGRWEVPPASSAWAPPATLRTAEGVLVHYDGRWRRRK